MKKRFLLIIINLFVLTTTSVIAGQEYFGGQYTLGGYSDDADVSAEPSVLMLKYGSFISDTFALEGRFGFGLGDTEVRVNGESTNYEGKVDNMIGIYAIAYKKINDDASFYGLAGFTKGKLTVSTTNSSTSDEDSGLSYGIGTLFTVDQKIAVNVEFLQYLSKSDFTFSGLGFGIISKF